MRTARLAVLFLVFVVLALLSGVPEERSASSFPNCCGGAPAILPPMTEIPHEHTVVSSHGFAAGTVTGADANQNGTFNEAGEQATAAAAPDANTHQHVDEHAFVNATATTSQRWRVADGSWTWDNRRSRQDGNAVGTPQAFDVGHGFVDENGYGFARTHAGLTDVRLRYRFQAAVPAGARTALRSAFAQWSAIDIAGTEAQRRLRTTGLEFVEVADGAAAEVEVQWRNINQNNLAQACQVNWIADPDTPAADVARCGAAPAGIQAWLVFDSNVTDMPAGNRAWEFGPIADVRAVVGPAGEPAEYHFMTTALHEIGHIVGLDHHNNWTDVVDGANSNLGCPAPGADNNNNGRPDNLDNRKACFDTLTQHSATPESFHGVRDLYSIATPDFGDAPFTYPTRLSDNGARAPTLAHEWLGPAGDDSPTTRESRRRPFDESDDGCGIEVTEEEATVEYTISVRPGPRTRYLVPFSFLYVAIWVDWNGDGDWTEPTVDAGELLDLDPDSPRFVHTDDPAAWGDGVNTMTYTREVSVPDEAVPGETWMRCRLVYGLSPNAHPYLEGNNGDEGLVPLASSPDNGGEIEDHQINCSLGDPDLVCVEAEATGVGGTVKLLAPGGEDAASSQSPESPAPYAALAVAAVAGGLALAGVAGWYVRRRLSR